MKMLTKSQYGANLHPSRFVALSGTASPTAEQSAPQRDLNAKDSQAPSSPDPPASGSSVFLRERQ
jgi:hypothetical protein